MSKYLGVPSTDKGLYYFISYNSEDEDRVKQFVKIMHRYNFPFWYDDGLKTGEAWEESIANHIKDSEGMILFMSKGVLNKPNSYVYLEYRMAKEAFNKKIYVVLLDEIKNDDVPPNYLGWWFRLTELQCVEAYSTNEEVIYKNVERILNDCGYSLDSKANALRLKEKFNLLTKEEKEIVMDDYLASMLSSQENLSKAKLFAELVMTGALVSLEDNPYIEKGTSITIKDTKFDIDIYEPYHSWKVFDMERIDLYKNNERIYIAFGLISINNIWMFYEEQSDKLFISYATLSLEEAKIWDEKDKKDEVYLPKRQLGIIIIDNPLVDPVGNNYPNLFEI